MPEISSLLDTYSLRARLLPALLVILPAGIALGLLLPALDCQKVIAGAAVCAGVPIFAANAVRSRGKRLEKLLTARWDGLPTTRWLRQREQGNDRRDLARRRGLLEKVTGITLPTAEEESADPAGTDRIYVQATQALITRVRETRDHYGLVQSELTDYGFRRNLLAVKPVGLGLLLVLLAVDIVVIVLGTNPTTIGTALVVQVLCWLGWLLVARPHWVREQADTYAERLFTSLEDPGLGAAPQDSDV